ncbi:MAG TPA: hypothetical protein ENI05_16005 [Porticoccus sp.]|nr:hypothetical protein [Porticoccus sp.]
MAREKNEEAFTIGKKVFSETDLEFTVDYDGDVFTLKHPAPYQKAAIEAEIARRLGGYSRDSFPAEHLALIEATTYVDALVVAEKSPNWWKSAWTCYDEELIFNLFRGYYQFRGKFQERIRGDGS